MKNKLRFKQLICALIMVGGWCLFFQKQPVQADPGSPVQVQLQVPKDNQVPANSGVVQVDLKPKKSVKFALYLKNLTSQPVQLKIFGGTAQTTEQGGLSLAANKHLLMDQSWQYSLADLGLKTQYLVLNANQEQVVPLKIKAPAHFKGSIAGSAVVQTLLTKQYNNQVNNFQMAFGVLANVGAVDKLQPKLRLGKVRVRSYAGQPQVVGQIHNQRPLYYGNGAVNYDIRVRGLTNNFDKHLNIPQGALAANSIAPITITLGNNPIKAGNYQYSTQVNVGNRNFRFQHNFTISPKQAWQLNRQNPNIKRTKWPLIVAIVICGCLLFGLFLWLLFKFAKNRGRKHK